MPCGPAMRPPVSPPARLTWLESPVQLSGMSHSFTASRQDTPRGSYCTRGTKPPCQEPTAQEPWQLAGSGPMGPQIGAPPAPAPHLAAFAAEPIAAHGVVGQRALLAAVAPALRTLLLGQRPARCVSCPAMPVAPAWLWRADPGPRSPPASRSRTPLPPPRSHCHTPEGPGAARTEGRGSKRCWGGPQVGRCHKPPKKCILSPGDGRTPKPIAIRCESPALSPLGTRGSTPAPLPWMWGWGRP